MKRIKIITSLFFIICNLAFGQQKYLQQNEKIICTFETKKGKIVMLAKDKNDKYIVYRFGTKNKIELEYPENKENSWSKFKFSYYSRGGGIQNEGMEINQISFINNGFKYIIFYNYLIVGNESLAGIRIVDVATDKISTIDGKSKTLKGKMFEFRDNNLLEITEDDEL